WRKDYLDEGAEPPVLVAIHELHHYSAAWTQALFKPALADAIAALIDTDVLELHHSTLHAKAPTGGSPFPMHQDIPFYPHENDRYIDALIHLDVANEESGCIKFLAGSHKLGKLPHITGPDTEPYLPTDQYRLEDAVSVHAGPGDVVVFNLWTVHGSAVNRSGRWRRLVRAGYRDPRNVQEGGQALGRPGVIVKGVRPKTEGVTLDVYGNWRGGNGA
ncbi:MAG TPA: phytanoyl-CoA dioxygenase family protein, partial [Ardenticatenaceae bacterium]|nr:phytanoyl-CoA dioxygenase family protein [Ardenticatenaceae bacterium]